MKKINLVIVLVLMCSNSFARDYSESGSTLDNRVTQGCIKYATKQAGVHLDNHFNVNGWAGGNIGASSYESAKKALPNHISFLQSQCYNMVAEVLELQLGWGPWQN